MAQASAMNGGDGTFSYAKNSKFQRDALIAAKNLIEDILVENLDVQKVLAGSSTFSIADLGCSVGPNTFIAVQSMVETVEHKYQSQGLDPEELEFQVFFNDQASNDFNTLFASLPERKYFVAGVPGSFYDRLFPSSSIHLAYSAYSLHWLSKVPDELQIRSSPAWNKGKIHYMGASDAVVKAYAAQFEEDMEVFLRARAKEIVPGGMIVIMMPGVPDGVLDHGVGISLSFLGSILTDMVDEGIIAEDQVDSFNIPHVYPSIKQMTNVVEKNGCFSIVKMELRNAWQDNKAPISMESSVMHIRAFTEGLLVNHFGNEIVDDIFKRAIQKKDRLAQMLFSSGIEIATQLFAVLMCK